MQKQSNKAAAAAKPAKPAAAKPAKPAAAKPAKPAKPAAAAAAAAAPAAAAPAVTPKPTRWVTVGATSAAQPLTWLVPANCKRPGTGSYNRAAAYWGAKTVGDYMAAGGTRLDLSWDVAHGFFTIGAAPKGAK